MNNNIDWKKYVIVFIITALLFISAFFLSNYFNSRKINQIKNIQDKISIDILSSETEYTLLQDLSCKNTSGITLSKELDDLGRKLEWSEINMGVNDEVEYLRRYYSLLEIKDYLLMKQIAERCGVKSAFVLFFYPNTGERCTDCEKQRIVLSALRNKYPELKVYAFDYSIDLSAVKAMLQIYKIKDTELPTLVLDNEVLTGFHDMEGLETRIKDVFELQETKPADKTLKENTQTDS